MIILRSLCHWSIVMVCACLPMPAYACVRLRTPVPADAYANAPMRTLEVASRHDDKKMMKKHDADLDKLILNRLVIIKMRGC